MSLFDLPKLPYEYSALNPYMDTETMTIHHSRHHQVYVNNINNVISGEYGDALKGMSLEAIQRNVCSVPEYIKTPVINAGGKQFPSTVLLVRLRKRKREI
jgi:superoxide dismutase, Fe-Mn family